MKSSAAGGKLFVNSNSGGMRFCIYVENGGTLNLEDGATIEMQAFDSIPNAGAVAVAGTMNMNGGKIVVADTTAVHLDGGTFTMNGGEISLHTAEGAELGYQAYGLSCMNATVQLNAGAITGYGFGIATWNYGGAESTVNTSSTFRNTAVEPKTENS